MSNLSSTLRHRASSILCSLSLGLAAGCAHTLPPSSVVPPQSRADRPQFHVLGEPGLSPPRRIEESCPPAPSDPKEAETKHLSGFARLSFVVHADGTVDSIEPEPGAPALFAEAGRAWLRSCRFEAGTLAGKPVDVRSQKVVAFRNPPPPRLALGEEPPPFDPLDPPAGVTPPHPIACEPLAVPWGGRYPAAIDFTVRRDGRVSDVSVREGPVEIPPPALELLLAWLDTCPFMPGRYEDKPVSLRSRIVNRFPPDYPWDEAVRAVRAGATRPPSSTEPRPGVDGGSEDPSSPVPLLAGDMTPPAPIGCNKPSMPETARQRGQQGMVLAGFVVEAGGRVTQVGLLNPGVPWILFRAVRDWVLGCKFTPAKTHDGRAVAVKVIQPFNFVLRP